MMQQKKEKKEKKEEKKEKESRYAKREERIMDLLTVILAANGGGTVGSPLQKLEACCRVALVDRDNYRTFYCTPEWMHVVRDAFPAPSPGDNAEERLDRVCRALEDDSDSIPLCVIFVLIDDLVPILGGNTPRRRVDALKRFYDAFENRWDRVDYDKKRHYRRKLVYAFLSYVCVREADRPANVQAAAKWLFRRIVRAQYPSPQADPKIVRMILEFRMPPKSFCESKFPNTTISHRAPGKSDHGDRVSLDTGPFFKNAQDEYALPTYPEGMLVDAIRTVQTAEDFYAVFKVRPELRTAPSINGFGVVKHPEMRHTDATSRRVTPLGMTLFHFPFRVDSKKQSDVLKFLLEQTDIDPNVSIIRDDPMDPMNTNRTAFLTLLESARRSDLVEEEKKESSEDDESLSEEMEESESNASSNYGTCEGTDEDREERDALAYLKRHPSVKAFLDCPRVRSTVDEVRFAIRSGIPVRVTESIVHKTTSPDELRCALANDINASAMIRIARVSGVNVLVTS